MDRLGSSLVRSTLKVTLFTIAVFFLEELLRAVLIPSLDVQALLTAQGAVAVGYITKRGFEGVARIKAGESEDEIFD